MGSKGTSLIDRLCRRLGAWVRPAAPPTLSPETPPLHPNRDRFLAGQQELLERVARGEDVPALLKAMVGLVQSQEPGLIASVLLVDPATSTLQPCVVESLPPEYNTAITGLPIGPNIGSCGAAAFHKRMVVATDLATDPNWAIARDLVLKYRLGACWSMPILARNGDVLGTFAIYRHEPSGPTPWHTETLRTMAHLAALALERQRDQVRQITLAALVEQSDDAIVSMTLDGRIASWNQGAQRLYGYAAAEVLGQPISLLDAEDHCSEHLQRAADPQQLGKSAETFETVQRTSSGRQIAVSVTLSLVRGADGRPTGMSLIARDISERQAINETLRQSEERLRMALHAVGLGIWEWYLQEDRWVLSPELQSRLGLESPVQHSSVFQRFVPPEDLPLIFDGIQREMEGKARGEIEFRLIDAQGKLRWVQTAAVRHDLQNGRVKRLIGTLLDITERKVIVERLRTSEQFVQGVLNSLPAHVAVLDRDGKLLSVNEPWLRFARENGSLDLETMGVGANYIDVCRRSAMDGDAYGQAALNGIAAVLAGKRSEFLMEYPCDTLHQRLWFLMHVTRLLASDGVIVTHTDITDRVLAGEALRDSEKRFRSMFEQAAVGLAEVSPEGQFRLVNERLCAITGYSREEMLARTFRDITHPDDLPEDEALARQLAAGTIPHYSLDKRYLRKDGQPVWIRLTGSGIRRADGSLDYFVAVIEDIAERKAAEEAMHRAKAEAERANSAKDHFLAVLSHELRTPLAPVLPALRVIENLVPPEGREYVEMARRNVEMEARLIDDLLDVTRIARGKIEVRRQPVALAEVLRQAVEVVLPDANARGVRWHLNVPEADLRVDADAPRLQQVFWNLLKNAIKFTPDGGEIYIQVRSTSDQVQVEIKDTGVGIPTANLARVFDAFEQGSIDVTRTFGGLGLGLAISKAIVELHGGTIAAHSEGPGTGATFTVCLPRLRTLPPQSAPASAARIAGRNPLPALRILLVEDHPDTARIMSRVLKLDGHQVYLAPTIQEAFALLTSQQPIDVLLSDLGLPDGSGHDLMRRILERGMSLPAIALSGFGMASDMEKSRAAGFVDHLTKPVNFDALREALAKAIAPPAEAVAEPDTEPP